MACPKQENAVEISHSVSSSSEDLSQEEKGLLNGTNPKRTNSHVAMFVMTQETTTRSLLHPSVKVFLAGFVSNMVIVVVAMFGLSVVKPGETKWLSTKPRQQSTNGTKIQTPLFLNETSSFAYLLDVNGNFTYSADYFLLQQGLDAQVNQAYCGVATVSTVLNSFWQDIAVPVDYEYDPYAYATQGSIFNDCVTSTVVYHDDAFDGIFAVPYGLGMGQVRALMQCFFPSQHWEVRATHVDPSQISKDRLRNDLIHYLTSRYARVVVNFDRSVVHEEGGGHWSPVGAYSLELDAFLILDVAKYKYPATWIPTEVLYRAMATRDNCGTWDFPTAQNKLSEDLLYPDSDLEFRKASQLLGCVETYRGYVAVWRH